MPDKKKKEVKKKEVSKEVTNKEFDDLLIIIQEMQENLDFINDKLARVLDRMGLEWSKRKIRNLQLMIWKMYALI